MKIDDIRTLIGEFKDSDLTSLSIKKADFELKLEREKEIFPQTQQMIIPALSHTQTLEQPLINATKITGEQIVAPMVGTFYQASSPESKPFVSVGDSVKKGQIVCIIEAMKFMNEVESDKNGVVKQILAENGQMVEFGEPLFVIE